MELFFQKIGTGEPFVILHGLYGSSDNWITFARQHSGAHAVYLIDLRNHGRSPHHPGHNYELMSDDLNELFVSQKIEKAIVLGHSMGGKTAMLFAAKFPEKIKGLIVVDIAPSSYASLSEHSPQVLTHMNIVNTMLSIDFSKYTTRTEIDDELAKTIPDNNIRQFILKNVQRNPDHSFRWKLNTDAINKALPEIMGSIHLEKILDNNRTLQFPALFIRGGKSNYLLPQHYNEIKKYFNNTQIETIPNAGHWVHAEQPLLFGKVIDSFIKKL